MPACKAISANRMSSSSLHMPLRIDVDWLPSHIRVEVVVPSLAVLLALSFKHTLRPLFDFLGYTVPVEGHSVIPALEMMEYSIT
jgi:hypothetical protein